MNVCVVYRLPGCWPIVQTDIERVYAQIARDGGSDLGNEGPDTMLRCRRQIEQALYVLVRDNKRVSVRERVVVANSGARFVADNDAVRGECTEGTARTDLHRFSISCRQAQTLRHRAFAAAIAARSSVSRDASPGAADDIVARRRGSR